MNTGLFNTARPGTDISSMRWLRTLWLRLQGAVNRSVEHSKPNMKAVALVAVVGFPLYYVVWTALFPQLYENLPLRLAGAVIALPLLLVDYWPASIRRYMPIYWFFGLCYVLPFFFTFMLLKNDASMVWAMSTMAGAVLLVLLVNNWLLLALMIVIGCGGAWVSFDLTGGELGRDWNTFLAQVPVYVFVLVAGSVFNYKTELVKQEKLRAVAATGSNIAHELRTPLLSIRSGIGGLNRYLPQLLEAYDMALVRGLPVQHIRPGHYRQLTSMLDRIDAETQYSNMVIDLLLSNAKGDDIDTGDFAPTIMSDCISDAVRRYPFKSEEERSRVDWHDDRDFVFKGSAILMVHVLFNLLKNGLQATAGKGRVTIWMNRAEHGCTLHFRDTGQGIEADEVPFVFDRFYSSSHGDHGTGIGLAFCKMVMRRFGGKVECLSTYGKFTEFVFHFPRAKGYGET